MKQTIVALLLAATFATVRCQSSNGAFRCPGRNEEFTDCGSACPDTCSSLSEPPTDCPAVCVSGCFCKAGFVRNASNVCVPRAECPQVRRCFGRNEEFNACGSACPATCSSRNVGCIAKCVPGCFCKAGFLRNAAGVCVRPLQCPSVPVTRNCSRLNEEFQSCGTACPETCETVGNPPRPCTKNCVVGCFCKEGFVRNAKGACVRPTECPPKCTNPNEEFQMCGTACPDTCDSISKPPQACILLCVSGCFCRTGFVRNATGVCVRPFECPTVPRFDACSKANEEFQECGTACPPRCDTLGLNIKCTSECVRGCFCKAGLVRNSQGDCVSPSKCLPAFPPVDTVNACFGKNERFDSCGTACPETCDSMQKQPRGCTERCVSGCFCKPGFVRNENGVCVLPSECFSFQELCIDPNAQFNECGSACPATCENLDKQVACTDQCVRGCFCKPGFILNINGVCVDPSECRFQAIPRIALDTADDPEECSGANEEFQSCGSVCQTTCDSVCGDSCAEIRNGTCVVICVAGCFCKPGFVRNAENVCVDPLDCPTSVAPRLSIIEPPLVLCSNQNEVFNQCGTACPETCDSKWEWPKPCPAVCVSGCFCRDGMLRNSEGVCVYPWQCPVPEVGQHCSDPNEEFSTCGSSCPKTCKSLESPEQPCTFDCRVGCFCKSGYVRNDDGLCVPPEECPSCQYNADVKLYPQTYPYNN